MTFPRNSLRAMVSAMITLYAPWSWAMVAKIELGALVLDNTLESPARRTAGQGGDDGESETDALLHAAGEFVRLFLIPSIDFNSGYGAHGVLASLAFVVVAHPLAEDHIVENGAVRHERHVLEHHADLLGTELANVLPGKGAYILAIDEQMARGSFMMRLT